MFEKADIWGGKNVDIILVVYGQKDAVIVVIRDIQRADMLTVKDLSKFEVKVSLIIAVNVNKELSHIFLERFG